jgi:ribosomal protein S18 acetylase RimI-like enzyme
MGSEVNIALASEKDLDAVVRLLIQQLAEHALHASSEDLHEAVSAVLGDKRLGFILTAQKGVSVVGCAYVSFVWSMEHAGRSAWLEEMYVIPEHRNEGVGEALLTEALARSGAEGCRAVDLEVDGSHLRAGSLYERQGFAALDRSRWVRKLHKTENTH